MKKSFIVKPGLAGLVIGFIGITLGVSSCKNKSNQHRIHNDPGALTIDSNLSHLLKPSNEQVVSSLPLIKAEYGSKIFTEEVQGVINYDTRNEGSIASRVSGRIERLLIKYNYQPVSKGQLIMEVYAPDLAAAQQELLFLQRTEKDPALLTAAKQRLQLLGMDISVINRVLSTGKVIYRIPVYSHTDGYILEKSAVPTPSATNSAVAAPAGDGMSGMGGGSAAATGTSAVAAPVNTPILLREGQYVNAGQSIFTIYNAKQLIAEFSLKPALAALVKKGDQFAFYKTADKSSIQIAHIGLIQPLFKAGENFTIARVYLNKSNFRVGELLTAKIPVLLPASWWLPQSAVLSLGNQHIVFKKDANVVTPKPIVVGVNIGGMVQVKTDVSNWEIIKNAAYLIDSESFVKESRAK